MYSNETKRLGNRKRGLLGKKQGAALMLVIFISLPMLFFCSAFLEIVLMDVKMGVNLAGKQQAWNNAEAGLLDAAKRIRAMDFTQDISQSYGLMFSEGGITTGSAERGNDNVVVTVLAYLQLNPAEYHVKCTGYYHGFSIPMEKCYLKDWY